MTEKASSLQFSHRTTQHLQV